MQNGTTPAGDEPGMYRGRHQRRSDLWRQLRAMRQQRPRFPRGPLHRPMWQEPIRGALYAAGSGIIALAFAWFQHWL